MSSLYKDHSIRFSGTAVQYSDRIVIEGDVYRLNLDVMRYQVPLDSLKSLTMRDVPPHSHLEILGVKAPEDAYEAEFFVLNSGGMGETEELSIYGGAGFEVEDTALRMGLRRLKQAFPYRDEYRGTSNPQFSSSLHQGKLRTFAFLSLKFDDRPDMLVRDAIAPFLEGFERLTRPYVHAFICHASEDKSVVREIANNLKSLGSEVWFDEWEIRVGDSIVQKINDALERVTHVVVCLSRDAVKKPWVKKELSVALMNQLSQASIKVLPILLDDCQVPAILADIKYATISAGIPCLVAELRESLFSSEEVAFF